LIKPVRFLWFLIKLVQLGFENGLVFINENQTWLL
jgi:hypothetical protein